MFEGFSPETVDFLWGIRLNNNREWFLEHKKDYVNHLYEPMKALGKELFTPFIEKSGELLKVSRIYRDARLHHPLPYKESLWICIRRDVQWWAENPCLFFEINPEGVDYGFFYWQPRTQTLKDLRAAWAAEERAFVRLVKKTEKATGMAISAETYKRPPQAAPSKSLERFYAWKKAISCIRHEDFSPQTFGPELAQRVSEFFGALTPLYDYFNRFAV